MRYFIGKRFDLLVDFLRRKSDLWQTNLRVIIDGPRVDLLLVGRPKPVR
jgi:hypothetical protein